MNRFFLIIYLGIITTLSAGQSMISFADSIRLKYSIPELAFAVVSADSIYELQTLGVQRINTSFNAKPNDKFRIGSNTKAITGFIAAQLVHQGKIKWTTKFFDLYPELKKTSKKAYYNVSLLDLLTFRTRLFPYTYTYAKPTKDQFKGNENEQRYLFTKWFFEQKPVSAIESIHFSNLGYIAAGLMLEKISGRPYKELVNDLGNQLGIQFGFGAPNSTDSLQPWGHNNDLTPEAPGDNYKLNWLLPAGNINVSLPDYVKFIQLQLQGLSGKSSLLTKEEFNFLHFGLTTFSVGWFWQKDEHQQVYSYNIGNPGTFLTNVFVFKNTNRAFILFSNAQNNATETGMNILFEELKRVYNSPHFSNKNK